MLSVENLVIGAGPGGLSAAHTLARAGREVLVLERNAEIGPKVCAGGLSCKALAFLTEMGMPKDLGRTLLAQASFLGEAPCPLDSELASVRTVSRRALGQWQAAVTRAAGAQIRTGTPVLAVDPEERTVTLSGGEKVRYHHLIGADGSCSLVRRALGLPYERRNFAVEYNVPGVDAKQMLISFEAPLRNGYFWIFPHVGYTSFGCGADRTLVPPRDAYRYLERRLRKMGVPVDAVSPEGFCIEAEYRGVDFGRVHLVGDAAALASPLSGEGIYQALLSGREVAQSILEPGYERPELRRWLRTRGLHARIARLWRRPRAQVGTLWCLRSLCRTTAGRRMVTSLFLA